MLHRKYHCAINSEMAPKRVIWLSLILVLSVACAQAEVMSIIKDKEGLKNQAGACSSRTSNYRRGANYNARGPQYQNRQDANHDDDRYRSVLGDAGMKDDRVRVALESWNFCNRVGNEGTAMISMPSPRHADCAQIVCNSSESSSSPQQEQQASCEVQHLVKNSDNDLKSGQAFPQGDFVDSPEPDDYVVQKELYLASLCETMSDSGPWHFWMIMLKNGNFDVNSGMCPSTAPPAPSRPFTSQAQPPIRWHNGSPSPHAAPQIAKISSSNEVGSPSLHIPRQTNKRTSAEGSSDVKTPSLVQLSLLSTDAKDVSPQGSPSPHPLSASKGQFPCFGPGCMNHPRIYHKQSTMQGTSSCANISDAAACSSPLSLSGSFYGTYDLDDDGLANSTISPDISYFSVDWSKDFQSGGWLFHHVLRVNHKYPWLMLYLRADATRGFSGGYPWETRGIMVKVPESPNFKVKLTLEVLQGGGSASQFYLLDIGGCWKNDGSDCDGNKSSDVTRYSEMIINPSTSNFCKPNARSFCPPYHVDAKTKQRIHRNDTARFPYTAYHYYCVPPNAQFAEQPYSVCDPYSNPQPQEIMQLLPHPEWAVHGYPSSKGQGWVGDPRTWTLDVGGLSQRLYFYQDPNTRPAPRKWTSVDVGTEIFISQQSETAEWILSDFDVLST